MLAAAILVRLFVCLFAPRDCLFVCLLRATVCLFVCSSRMFVCLFTPRDCLFVCLFVPRDCLFVCLLRATVCLFVPRECLFVCSARGVLGRSGGRALHFLMKPLPYLSWQNTCRSDASAAACCVATHCCPDVATAAVAHPHWRQRRRQRSERLRPRPCVDHAGLYGSLARLAVACVGACDYTRLHWADDDAAKPGAAPVATEGTEWCVCGGGGGGRGRGRGTGGMGEARRVPWPW
jgi:hypothetical protein